MSQTPSEAGSVGGKTPRERRRLSSEQPYKRPRTSTSSMPATRRSPARPPPIEAQDDPLPLAAIMQELALLRKSMETRFSEADKKSDALRGELVGKLDANDKAVADLQIAVTDVTLSVDDNQRAIHEVRAEVERREVELPGKVRSIVQEVLDKSRLSSPLDGTGPRHRPLRDGGPKDVGTGRLARQGIGNDEAYNLARKSLRLWPVSREGDLMTRTREFLVSELLMDQQYAVGLNFTVRRAATAGRTREKGQASSQKVRDEVLAVFESARDRDEVRSHAKNLEKKGRGLRLEIPDHLWPSFRVLQDLGYELKQKNAALRRNVLFDDTARDLKLDFSFDSVNWKTVSPDEARKSLLKCRPARPGRTAVTATELDGLLGAADDEDVVDVDDMSVNEEY